MSGLLLAVVALLGSVVVDDRLPAGNIVFEKIEGDVVKVRQDLRDTAGGWFYWAMRVTGAAGRTLRFDFTDPYGGGPVGVRGPVVSTDRGKTFSFPLDGKAKANTFTWKFAADQDEVWFYECHPYLPKDWQAFLDAHAESRGEVFETGVLCRTRKGREVPNGRFGCLSGKPRYRILLTSRHHCSETMATYVLEGTCAAFFGKDDLGRWLRENVELMVVPFIDYDGALDGDQGKNRKPHDHNRDYGVWVHPETKAMTEWVRSHADNRVDIYVDLHCPWIRGQYNEWLYTPGKSSATPYIHPGAEARFSKLLERVQCGSIRYRAADDLPFGKAWNTNGNYANGTTCIKWAGANWPSLRICRTFEVPFANANGAVVTPSVCRDLGRDLAKCYCEFLSGDAAKVTFVGDVMCSGHMLAPYRDKDGRYDYRDIFAAMKPLFAESDCVVANLETPISPTSGDLTRERWCFNSPREFALAVKDAGVDFVFTANNHCLDRGPAGVKATVAALDALGLRHTGTFATPEEAAERAIIDVKGFRLGMLSYTYGSNAFSNHQYLNETNSYLVNFFQRQELSEPLARAWFRDRNSPEGKRYAEMEKARRPENLTLPVYERQEEHEAERAKLKADVARMKAANPDFVVMGMHAGGQYNPEATKYTKELAGFIAGCGVDLIAGSHEHVVHGTDFTGMAAKRLIAYSLGNFNSCNGVWIEPTDKMAEYSVAWHVYLRRGADGKAKVEKTTFSVLKTLRGSREGRIKVFPAAQLWRQEKDAAKKAALERDILKIARTFAGRDLSVQGVCDEFNPAGPECIDGIYPHLAMFNREGECGTGAVVPWAGSLWAVTYGPHLPVGSSDKLYEITPDLRQIIHPESIGGTPANRMIHRETNQLLIGPYVIDAKGKVRTIPYARMPGRPTGAARHLVDPANKVYVATMETGLYELDMNTLAVNTLIRENGMNEGAFKALAARAGARPHGWDAAPITRVPGYHSKGLASGFGRVFISNNGEDSAEARRNPFVPSGVLAWWNRPGSDWSMIRRCQFTEVTTRDGIHGNEHPAANPVWALGWDAKSVILAVTTNGEAWTTYRLPKASHAYDGAHGWNTEWPRIRDIGEDYLLATMHGTFWKFPKDFSPASPNGIRPLSTYLKVIGDFCRWGDRIVFGCDDQAQCEFLGTRTLKKGAPKRDRSQSNLWFVKPEELATFGPPSGEGWVWLREDVKAGAVSEPFLFAGYGTMRFALTDAAGRPKRYELVREGDWVRVKALEDVKGASAHFRYGPPCPEGLPAYDGFVEVRDDDGSVYRFPNVNGDRTVICREVATERDLLYVGGVFYEVPADNAGGFKVLRPIALASEPVRSIEAKLGLVYVNGKPMAVDSLWRNGTAPAAYWLWEKCRADGK